jgi:hypothetical protein
VLLYKIITFHEITFVKRAKAAAIFPTTIEIIAGGKKVLLRSAVYALLQLFSSCYSKRGHESCFHSKG